MAFQTTPTSERRIDDARSTRSLSTYLAQDTTSTPPFAPEQGEGGFNVSTVDGPENNDCGAEGTNIVHLQWTETVVERKTYVANYRFVIEDGAGRVRRVTCSAPDGEPYAATSSIFLTRARSRCSPGCVADVGRRRQRRAMSFTLTGQSGETVLVEVASRNPSEFFPT